MQVEAILVAEGLNDILTAHLIPSAFIVQESIIGQGHFGQVCRGKLTIHDINVDKVVALKSLKCECKPSDSLALGIPPALETPLALEKN